jgi:membrane protease YdiL (CAAX protease family)
MTQRAYDPHLRFVLPARARSEPKLLVIGILLVEVMYLASVHLMEPFLQLVPLANPAEVAGGSTPRGLLVQLYSFLALGLAVVLVSRKLHGRGLASLIGQPSLAVQQMLQVTLLLTIGTLAIEFIPPDVELLSLLQMRPLGPWLALLPVALLALLIQTGAEELFYRGYVQQQLAARFDQPWVWLVLPSLLFASAHYTPELPPVEAAHYMIWAFCFGLAAADLTARSGTLGPAIGFHLVNNALAFLLFGQAGGMDSGLALFLFPADPAESLLPPPIMPHPLPTDGMAPVSLFDPGFLLELVGIGMLWVGARIAIRR